MDTPHFQRLRDLKQLGATYYVFPGASHNRFEHSLGVSHLSGKFFDRLCNNSPDVVNEWDNGDGKREKGRIKEMLEVAGMVHDLGHGPFSHLFDRGFLRRVYGGGEGDYDERGLLVHEGRSRLLFEDLVERFGVEMDRGDVRFVGDLVLGREDGKDGEAKAGVPGFVFDVVNNKRNGLDTDKFDYLARDIKNLGMSFGFDHQRLIHFSRVVHGLISFHKREVYNVYDLFLTRFKLHRLVCNHRTTIAIDGMITDAFIEADSVLGLSKAINDVDAFLKLSDSVLKVIEFSNDAGMGKAKHIIERLRRRQLYRFVHEVIVPDSHAGLELCETDVTTCQEGGGYNLKPEDIYVTKSVCNLGMKSKNPVDHVNFYGDDQAWYGGVEEVIPRKFEERLVRVYTRCEQGDVEKVRNEARKAFRNCLRRHGLIEDLSGANANGTK